MRTTRPKINRRGSRPNSGVHSMSDSTRIPPSHARRALIALFTIVAVLVAVLVVIAPALAQTPAPASSHSGGEASLKIPDLGGIAFSGVPGRTLLMLGLIVCGLGLVFGLVIFNQLKNLPVHASMREISELIYETCKTYLITQGKFILLLEVFIGVIMVFYFGVLQQFAPIKVAIILLFIPGDYAGSCFIGFAIGESLGAAALRIAGGIFTKIADIGSDLMKIVFKIKEDDARNPGVIADCTGDNAGDSVGPSADGFETYGVTGVALITFILLGVKNPAAQVQLLVWIFVMRIAMLVASAASYFINGAIARARYLHADHMNFEAPLTSLVWLTSIISITLTYAISAAVIPSLAGDTTQWWKLATIISCGTLAGAVIPELVKVFTSTESRHVREVVTSAQEGGASLGILSGFVAGNFSAYYLGMAMIVLMSIGYMVGLQGLGNLMIAAPVFAFGLVAFGFLGMGPVTIAVDSYGPVTDNAQSVFELSLIEQLPGIHQELKRDFRVDANFGRAKDLLEENDGAGNTFKATAKPVLIGTAVVGATTMIFSIIMALTNGLTENVDKLSLLHAPFLLGIIAGGAMIYWFTGASTQAVTTGAYRAVEFIKANIRLESSERASVADSKKVVEICTQYAQKGMLNIFIAVFFAALSFAFVEPFFFIGYLISIAMFGLFQAIFMANAGGAWDNAKKIVEVELKQKGTPLHDATVIGDTVGDPFKDTSSVALNPVIKFTTLFGLLAVELAVSLTSSQGGALAHILAAAFFLVAFFFVYKSFYGMRIKGEAA